MKIDCIAVDDEPLALDIIKDYTGRVPYLNLIASFDNALDAMTYLKANKVGLVFLDIQMEELTGIQMLSVLKNPPPVILTTAYDQYAIKGYEFDVVDYLLKPISFERFLRAVDKVYEKIKNVDSNTQNKNNTDIPLPNQLTENIDYCFVKTEFHLEMVRFKDILYIEGMGDYLMIHTPARKIMTLQSFKKAEDTLPSHLFCRVHKSYMVALDKIESIERNRIKIGNTLIPVSESYKRVFFEMVERRGLL